VISSAEIGLAKPDPAIYRLALERLRVQAGEAIFVDDLARNTEAAESIGLPSLVFESPEQLRRELTERGILP
jgi:HAD superfamily hydrolase (TIGR01509 family)